MFLYSSPTEILISFQAEQRHVLYFFVQEFPVAPSIDLQDI